MVEPARRAKAKVRRVLKHAKHALAPKKTMQAAAIDRFGPPSVLKIHELPMPEPGPNEVLIELHAAGVGIWDADIRKGWWPEGRPKFPLVLGTDGAGIVAGRGAKVRRYREGDRVWAYEFINRKGGFYAEYVAASADNVGLAPDRLTLLQAGAAAVTGLTALQGIDVHLRVQPREAVVIFGASGAVGSLAVQFAKRRQARVIGTARGSEAERFVAKLGADEVVETGSMDDALEQARAFAPEGIDAVLALAGGQALQKLLTLVRPGGRVAHPNGVEPEPKPPPKVKLVSYDAEAGSREFARLALAVEEARLQVPLAAVYPLEQAAQAHQRLEKGHVLGRIALQIREGNQLKGEDIL